MSVGVVIFRLVENELPYGVHHPTNELYISFMTGHLLDGYNWTAILLYIPKRNIMLRHLYWAQEEA